MRSQIVVNHFAFIELSKHFSYPRCDLDGLDDRELSPSEDVQQRLAAGIVQDQGRGAGLIQVLHGVQDSGAGQRPQYLNFAPKRGASAVAVQIAGL
jgi:hypothetical protein